MVVQRVEHFKKRLAGFFVHRFYRRGTSYRATAVPTGIQSRREFVTRFIAIIYAFGLFEEPGGDT